MLAEPFGLVTLNPKPQALKSGVWESGWDAMTEGLPVAPTTY